MKYYVLVGYRVTHKIQVRVEYGSGTRKILLESTWITSEVITKIWNMCLQQRRIFHGHRIFQHFFHVTNVKSNNIVFETSKYHS